MKATITVRAGTPRDLVHVCEHWLAMYEEVGNYFERYFPSNWRSNSRTIRLHASRFGRAIYERIGFVPTNEMGLPAR